MPDSASPPAIAWSLLRRIAFRFGVVLAVLFVLPFPIDALPATTWLVDRYTELWDWLTRGFGDLVGVDVPPMQPTGSGDTTSAYVQLLLLIVIALVGAAVWSVIDRRPVGYPRLAAAVRVALRYWLAVVMVGYGFAKLFVTQFPFPSLHTLEHPVGQMSPMGLLWTFMGYSTPYNLFTGLAEAVGGMLLFWRRTTTLGALILAAVLTNVVMLNFCYDVPVKLLSTILLVISGILIAPDARRLVAAVIGRAALAGSDAPPWAPLGRWPTYGLKVAFVGWVLVHGTLDELDARDQIAGPLPPLYGIYDVERHLLDGVEPTDDTRWRRVIIDRSGRTSIRTTADAITRYATELDETAGKLTLKHGEASEQLSYTRATDRVELDGTWGKQHVHATLHRRDPADFLLVSRGYHWIQELPFNR